MKETMTPETCIEQLANIILAGIRGMMEDVDNDDVCITEITMVSKHFTEWMRKREVKLIRDDLNYYAHFVKINKDKWLAVAAFMECEYAYSVSRELAPPPLPQTEGAVHAIWFDFFKYAVKYSVHRQTAMSDVANDVARFWKLFSQGQQRWMADYLKENVGCDDARSFRMLAAFADTTNRYMVEAHATKEQFREYCERNNVTVIGGYPEEDLDFYGQCFIFDSAYRSVEKYLQLADHCGALDRIFIIKEKKLEC